MLKEQNKPVRDKVVNQSESVYINSHPNITSDGLFGTTSYDRNDVNTHRDGPHSLLHKSHKGLYLAILVFTCTLLAIVLFYVKNDEDPYMGALIYHGTNIILTTLLLVAISGASITLRQLGRSTVRVNLIDDMLLLFSMSGFILLHLFITVSCLYFICGAYEYTAGAADDLDDHATRLIAIIEVTATLLETVQCIAQTLFVIDGLQRFARDQKQETDMRGRGLLAFLIIVNVCMWIYKTLVIKEVLLARHLDFYGSTAWPIILSICLPLQLFFFFHSSVCLAEVWSQAYKMKPESILETTPMIE